MFPTRRITTSGGDVFRDEFSLAFDGTNDNIRIPEIVYDVDGSTVSFIYWAKRANADNVYCILGDTSYANQSHIRHIADGTIKMETDTEGDEAQITPISTDFEWHHYIIVCNSGTVTAYQDGVSLNVTGNVNGDNLTVNTIGGQGGSGVVYEWFGNISEIAVYNIALSSSQAKTIYNGREPFDHKNWSKTGNLTQWWRMGDGVLDSHLSKLEIIGDETNPTLGSNLVDADASVLESGTYGWSAEGSNEIANDSNTLKITYVDSTYGAAFYFKSAEDGFSTDLTIGQTYKVSFDTKINTGSARWLVHDGSGYNHGHDVTNTSFARYEINFVAKNATTCRLIGYNMGAGEILHLDNLKVQEVNGNPGIMTNMTASDFEGDTP